MWQPFLLHKFALRSYINLALGATGTRHPLDKGAERNPVNRPHALAAVRRPVPSNYPPEFKHASPLTAALDRARQALLERQAPDGHWVGELQGDTILESEYVLLMGFLGRETDEVCRKAARYILGQQMAGGGWSNYPD